MAASGSNVAYKPLSTTVDVFEFSTDDEDDDLPASLLPERPQLRISPSPPPSPGTASKPFSTYCIAAAACLPLSCLVLLIICIVSLSRNGTTPPPDPIWWQTHAVYQIYPRSFQDSDGDGMGDLRGIISRLDYLRDLGVRAVWLSPIYASPMKDFGYDISDYNEIYPKFGTMDDFDDLVKKMHDNDMYLIMDFVPNHTSDQHDWFKKSVQRVEPYTDYYVWVSADDPADPRPPNNWLSRFGNSSWQWNPVRKQFYLHKFLISQPDLNYRNPHVKQEMLDVLKFWLDRGVDGFRIDAITHLVERNDNNWRLDEPVDSTGSKEYPPNAYPYLDHKYTVNQNETLDIAREWADFFDQYGKQHNKRIFSVAEMTDLASTDQNMRWYGTGLDLPFNFGLADIGAGTTATEIHNIINDWMTNMPVDKWPNWVLGNHDLTRVTSRLAKGAEYVDMLNMMLLLLPGTPTCYYGDEIGMTMFSFDIIKITCGA